MTEPRLSIYTAAAPAPVGQEPASFAGEAARLVKTAESLIRSLEEHQTLLATHLDSIRQQSQALLDTESDQINRDHDWIQQRARARSETASRLQAAFDQLQGVALREAHAVIGAVDNAHGALARLEVAATRRGDGEETYLATTARGLRLAAEGARALDHDLNRWSAQSSLLAARLERTAHAMDAAVARRENQAGCRALQLGDPSAAEQHFQNVLRLDPSPRGLDNLALAHLAARRPGDARRLLEDPRSAQLPLATIQARRSQVALDSGDAVRSLEEAEIGLRSDPDNATLLRLAATAALALGRAAAALHYLRRLCPAPLRGHPPSAADAEAEARLARRLA